MIRIVVLAATLAFATGASAAQSQSQSQSKSKSKASTGPKGTTDAKRSIMNAKRALKTAVDLCSAPGRCEQGSNHADREYMSMLEGADRSFIEACLACSTSEKCDAERDRIREGKRSPGSAPCE